MISQAPGAGAGRQVYAVWLAKGLLINNRIGVGVVAIWDSQIDLEFIESVGD
jgi:hypothetical protein